MEQMHPDHRPFVPVLVTGQAVEDWLTYGLGKQSAATVQKYRIICRVHIIPLLGARKLRDLTTREVEAWLLGRSKVLSTR